MKLIPNTNPDLVLVQVNVDTFGEALRVELTPEIPIRAFKEDVALGVIDFPRHARTEAKPGVGVLMASFHDTVLKDKSTGVFFSQPHFPCKLRTWDWEIWDNEEMLRAVAVGCFEEMLAVEVLKARGEQPIGVRRFADISFILDLNFKDPITDLEVAALYWLTGAEGVMDEEFDTPVQEVLEYVNERGLQVPPRLLAAVEQKTAA